MLGPPSPQINKFPAQDGSACLKPSARQRCHPGGRRVRDWHCQDVASFSPLSGWLWEECRAHCADGDILPQISTLKDSVFHQL